MSEWGASRKERIEAELERQRRKNESAEAKKKRKKKRDFWRRAQNGE